MNMRLGEKAELEIRHEYAYKDMGLPPMIPGKATLIFLIELILVTDRRATRWMLSDPELIKVGLRFKDDGNSLFKNGNFAKAEGIYRDALCHLDQVKHKTDELSNLKVTIM